MSPAPRPAAERKARALELLSAPAADVWVATASVGGAGVAHLVPLSLAWVEERVVVALDGTSVTGVNLSAVGARARLAVGPTRDVVMIDAVVESVVSVAAAGSSALADAYAAQADWDPRGAGESYVYVVLLPERLQAWREANEIPDRTLLRGGEWLV